MADALHDDKRRQRIHLTVVVLLVLAALMFLSAAWLRVA